MDLSENCRNRQLTILTYIHVHICTKCTCAVSIIICLLSFSQFLSELLPHLLTHPAIHVPALLQ